MAVDLPETVPTTATRSTADPGCDDLDAQPEPAPAGDEPEGFDAEVVLPERHADSDAAKQQDPADDEIELIVGITRAVGTPSTAAMEQLRNSLTNHGYDVRTIKVSALLEDSLADRDEWDPGMRPDLRIEALIGEGNRLCTEAKDGAELARRVIASIKDERERPAQARPSIGPATADQQEEEGKRASRRAFIVDSLKRPAEVSLLRGVYGDHFVLIGLQAPESTRGEQLVSRIAPRHDEAESGATDAVAHLMQIDASESADYGQKFLDTFPLSDVFIDASTDEVAYADVRRAISILFGDPQAPGPTDIEFGMQLATTVSARSPELGLRVGAAILGNNGDVIATGANHHPTRAEAPSYDASALDIRHLAMDTLAWLSQDTLLSPEASRRLQEEGDEYVQELLRGTLKRSQLREITEYQRPVHAEMDAIMSASRQRADLVGATVMVTDFPCHNCAKHLIALGLRVVYLAPYLKSRAAVMYGDDIDCFVPFTGVAPRRYAQWFVYGRDSDRKDSLGIGIQWTEDDKRRAAPKVTNQITTDSKSIREDFAASNPGATGLVDPVIPEPEE